MSARYLVDVDGEIVGSNLRKLQAHRLAWSCMRPEADLIDICSMANVHDAVVVWVKRRGKWRRMRSVKSI